MFIHTLYTVLFILHNKFFKSNIKCFLFNKHSLCCEHTQIILTVTSNCLKLGFQANNFFIVKSHYNDQSFKN